MREQRQCCFQRTKILKGAKSSILCTLFVNCQIFKFSQFINQWFRTESAQSGIFIFLYLISTWSSLKPQELAAFSSLQKKEKGKTCGVFVVVGCCCMMWMMFYFGLRLTHSLIHSRIHSLFFAIDTADSSPVQHVSVSV